MSLPPLNRNTCKAEKYNLVNVCEAEAAILRDPAVAALNDKQKKALTDSFEIIRQETLSDHMNCIYMNLKYQKSLIQEEPLIYNKNLGSIERGYKLTDIIKALEPSQSK
ncbi:MAG: hypothetical protein ACD_73C00175G0001 [uncultured bacterium]|nr:MAG: hypothetical protein ACD_73C00175G0001 [uncultured bacterium]